MPDLIAINKRKNEAQQSATPAQQPAAPPQQVTVQPSAPARQSNGYVVTSTKGKQYTIDNNAADWIRNRYMADGANSYGYDDADQMAKASGQMSARMRKTYKNSNVDRQLAELGLPSEKNLERYLAAYDQWHTGGIKDVIGDSVSQDAMDWVGTRFKDSWQYENTLDDQQRRAQGLMPGSYASQYADTELDEDLERNGLPPAKYLSQYLNSYGSWHTGSMKDVFGSDMPDDFWQRTKDFYRNDWEYEDTPEDQERKKQGIIPSKLLKEYGDTEIDEELLARGLPSMKSIGKYASQYNDASSIDALYANAAFAQTRLRADGIKNDNQMHEVDGKRYSGKELYAKAFFDELERPDEAGNKVYGGIMPLFKNNHVVSGEEGIDPTKDYVTERGRLITSEGKAETLADDYANGKAFSYDDFMGKAGGYYDKYIKDVPLENGQTIDEYLQVLDRDADEEAVKDLYAIDDSIFGDKGVRDFIRRYQTDYPSATPQQMFDDMFKHGVDEKTVEKAMKAMQRGTTKNEDFYGISNAFVKAKQEAAARAEAEKPKTYSIRDAAGESEGKAGPNTKAVSDAIAQYKSAEEARSQSYEYNPSAKSAANRQYQKAKANLTALGFDDVASAQAWLSENEGKKAEPTPTYTDAVAMAQSYLNEHGEWTPENMSAAFEYLREQGVPEDAVQGAAEFMQQHYGDLPAASQNTEGAFTTADSVSRKIADFASTHGDTRRGEWTKAQADALFKELEDGGARPSAIRQAIEDDASLWQLSEYFDNRYHGADEANSARWEDEQSKDLKAYTDAAKKADGEDEATISETKLAIQRGLAPLIDNSDETGKPVSVDDVLAVIDSVRQSGFTNPVAVQKALQDLGFSEFGGMNGFAWDLTQDWDTDSQVKLRLNIGNERTTEVAPEDQIDDVDRIIRDTVGEEWAGHTVVAPEKQVNADDFNYALRWAQEKIANGDLTAGEAFNILAANGYQDEMETYMPNEWHEAHFKENLAPTLWAQSSPENAMLWDDMTPEERDAVTSEMWGDLTDEQKASIYGNKNWWKQDPTVYRTFGQALEQQLQMVLPGFGTGIVGDSIVVADAIGAAISGRPEMGEFTQKWRNMQKAFGQYGYVEDNVNGAKVAQVVSDVTQELMRMQYYGMVSGSVGTVMGGTAVGAALAKAASGNIPVVKQVANMFLKTVQASPFVVSAFAGNYADAKELGASNSEATWFGTITGLTEGILESFEFDELWGKAIGQEKFAAQLLNGKTTYLQRLGIMGKARLASMAVSGLGEWTEESIGYGVETFLKMRHDDTWGKGTEWSVSDWLEQAMMGFITGAVGGGISGGSSINAYGLVSDFMQSSDPMFKQAFPDNYTAVSVAENLPNGVLDTYRKGGASIMSVDAYKGVVGQIANCDTGIENAAKVLEQAKAAAQSKLDSKLLEIEQNRAKAAGIDVTNTESLSQFANLCNKLGIKVDLAAGNLAGQVQAALDARANEAQRVYDTTVSDAEAACEAHQQEAQNQKATLQKKIQEHYAGLYLLNHNGIVNGLNDEVAANTAMAWQNGAKYEPEAAKPLTEQAAAGVGLIRNGVSNGASEASSVAEAEQAAQPTEDTATKARELAYNRVYKDQEAGKAYAEGRRGESDSKMTRVQFAENERHNFQAKTTAKMGKVTLELAGLEAADGMSAKEIFAEAKKAMTPEAAQKLDLYQKLSKALKLNMVVQDVVAGTSGYVHDGKLYVTLSGKQSMLRVASHELTHYMKQYAGGMYDVLRTHLVNEFGGQEAFDKEVAKKAQEYGLDINTEQGRVEADDELCAELCEKMLENKDALERFVNTDLDAAKTLKARLGKTLVAIKSAIRSIGTSDAKTRGDLIKEQDTIESWYKGLSDAIDNANKANTTTSTDVVAEPTTVTETQPQAPPVAAEGNADLYMDDESARKEQLRADLEELAKKGTKVNGLRWQEVNDVLDRVIFGDKSNYSKADYAQIRGMLAQLIPEVQAMVNGDENVDADALNERVSAALDYMLERYHESSQDFYGLRDIIPNKIALTEAAYNELRSREMTLRQASNELRNALGGKFVSFVYKQSPSYNNAMKIDELWTSITDAYGERDGYGNVMEDAIALIDYARDHNTQSSFDDLYGSQREDVISSQVGEFLDAVQSMVEGKAQTNTVRFDLDDTGLTEEQYNRVVDYVDNAIAGEGINKAPYIQFGTVNPELVEGLHRFGVDIKADTPHRLEDNFIRHLRRSHGIEKAKTWGINDSDVRAVPYIVNKYDRAYYRELPNGLKGILYAKDFVDTTYYVEGILKDGSLSGRQMIKVPLYEIPDIYANDVQKEKALIALPDGALSPKSYVQDVTRDRASNNSIVSSFEKINPSAQHSLDDDYMPLAERYDAGIATDEDVEELQREVYEAADAAGFPAVQYDPVIYDANGEVVPLSERFGQDFTGNRYTVDDDLDELVKKYGAIEQGRNPRAREVRVPRQSADNMRVSKFTRSLDESSKATDAQSAEIESEIGSEADRIKQLWSYIPKSNDETMRQAKEFITARQPGDAMREFHDMVVGGKYGTRTSAIGLQLLADSAERGDWASVKEIAYDLRVLATEAGQNTQIFNTLKDLKGVGSAWYIESLVKKMNSWYADDIQQGKMDPITVSEEAMNQVRAAKTQAEVDAAEEVVAREIAPQLPLKLDEKLSNWRYLSMLGNPVTHIRNVTGNNLMSGMSAIKDVVASGVQRILEKVGLTDESGRSHARLTSADKSYWDSFAQQSYEEQQRNLQGGGKLGFKSFLQQNMRMFDNKVLDTIARGADNGSISTKKGIGGLLENIKNNGAMGMLEVEDAWGLEKNYKRALMEYMKARGYTLNEEGKAGKVGKDGAFTEMTNEQMNKAIEWATNQAWTNTFRGPSQLATELNKISKMNTVSKMIVEGVMPFKKTPINIARQGFMYSPGGIVVGTTELFTKVKQGKMSAATAIDHLSSGLTGTALFALGAMLAKAGILRGNGEDKKKYETYLEDTGDQTYSFKFGNASIDMSAIAPATIPLFMGAALQEAVARKNDGEGVDLSAITDVLAGTLNPFMEMSFMASLNSALKNYNNDGIGGALGSTIMTSVQNYGSQYLPTLGGKVAQFLDPTRRTTKSDATSPIGGNLDYYGRSLLKKVPGAEALLQPDVNVWGRTDTKDSFGAWALDFANKFILSTNVKITNRDAVDNELIRVVESTGNVDFLPSDGSKSFTVKGQKYTMNAKQYTQFSQERGQAAYAALKDVMVSSAYQSATDEEKASMLKKALDAAYKQVNNVWKERLGAYDN